MMATRREALGALVAAVGAAGAARRTLSADVAAGAPSCDAGEPT